LVGGVGVGGLRISTEKGEKNGGVSCGARNFVGAFLVERGVREKRTGKGKKHPEREREGVGSKLTSTAQKGNVGLRNQGERCK